jgi:hypothetical protein
MSNCETSTESEQSKMTTSLPPRKPDVYEIVSGGDDAGACGIWRDGEMVASWRQIEATGRRFCQVVGLPDRIIAEIVAEIKAAK